MTESAFSRLVSAVFTNVGYMSVAEAARVGGQLPHNYSGPNEPAARLLGAAARMKVARHDAEMDFIAVQLEEAE